MAAVVIVGIVPVAGSDDRVVVAGMCGEVSGDAFGDGVTAGHAERAAFGEVILDIDDEECLGHASSIGASRPISRGAADSLEGWCDWWWARQAMGERRDADDLC